MKPIKKIKEKEVIDDSDKHNKILFDLGILDDEEDWELYKKQEEKLDLTREMDFKDYLNYIGLAEEEINKKLVEYEKRVIEVEEYNRINKIK